MECLWKLKISILSFFLLATLIHGDGLHLPVKPVKPTEKERKVKVFDFVKFQILFCDIILVLIMMIDEVLLGVALCFHGDGH